MENFIAVDLLPALASLWRIRNLYGLDLHQEEKEKTIPQDLLLERHRPPRLLALERVVQKNGMNKIKLIFDLNICIIIKM